MCIFCGLWFSVHELLSISKKYQCSFYFWSTHIRFIKEYIVIIICAWKLLFSTTSWNRRVWHRSQVKYIFLTSLCGLDIMVTSFSDLDVNLWFTFFFNMISILFCNVAYSYSDIQWAQCYIWAKFPLDYTILDGCIIYWCMLNINPICVFVAY